MEGSNGRDGAVIIDVGCGSSHTVALLDCGIMVSWGKGEDGQLGHGDADEVLQPKAIHALLNKQISSVSCGAEYTLAASASQQQVYSWGWGDFGRLGHGDGNDVFMPKQIAFFSGRSVKTMACGDTHTLVITHDGAAYSFGRNQHGQLGHGSTMDMLSPRHIAALEGKAVRSVAAGAEHTVAATEDGEVYAWGWGRYGNLGDNDRSDRHLPTRVHALDNVRVTGVACGWRHSAAVSEDGAVYTFGWSKYGQLGHGDLSDRLVPTQVAALARVAVRCVAGGWRHSAAVTTDGAIYAWGWNKFGQLGLGDALDRTAPAQLPGLTQPVRTLSCGWRHTVAITESAEVYSWGRGVSGQLGHGDEADVHSPKRLEALCAGTLTRGGIVATATTPGEYVAPADRYAVVPGEPGCSSCGGANGAAVPSAVPSADGDGDGGDAVVQHGAKKQRLGASAAGDATS